MIHTSCVCDDVVTYWSDDYNRIAYESWYDVLGWCGRHRCSLIFEVLFYELSTFWATSHWTVNQKSTFHLLFIVPKSSFGENKISQFRTHDLTKELEYVSTQIQANLDTRTSSTMWSSCDFYTPLNTGYATRWTPLKIPMSCHHCDHLVISSHDHMIILWFILWFRHTASSCDSSCDFHTHHIRAFWVWHALLTRLVERPFNTARRRGRRTPF